MRTLILSTLLLFSANGFSQVRWGGGIMVGREALIEQPWKFGFYKGVQLDRSKFRSDKKFKVHSIGYRTSVGSDKTYTATDQHGIKYMQVPGSIKRNVVFFNAQRNTVLGNKELEDPFLSYIGFTWGLNVIFVKSSLENTLPANYKLQSQLSSYTSFAWEGGIGYGFEKSLSARSLLFMDIKGLALFSPDGDASVRLGIGIGIRGRK